MQGKCLDDCAISKEKHLSNVQNPYGIPLNPGWLIGILIMASYIPYITG